MGVLPGERGFPIATGHPKVVKVYCSFPAHQAGLRVGDVLLSANNTDTRTTIGVLSADRVGVKLDLTIARNGEIQSLVLVAVAHPRASSANETVEEQ